MPNLDHLTPLQYAVTQEAATEPPFQNEYWNEFSPGIYVDRVTGTPLFSSRHKYDAGCGWPSFSRPLFSQQLEEREDTKLAVPRTEVVSRDSQSHLGHVFADGPPETGLRYCMNSAALRFVPRDSMIEEGYGDLLPFVDPV